jgi:hypothetical protein
VVANQDKRLVDGMDAGDAMSETARAALQGLVGCVGSAAGGSGDCGSAAMGASASVFLNYLLNEAGAPQAMDRNGDGVIDPDERVSLADQQARTDLVATIVAGIASSAGLTTPEAMLAAQTETQNNQLAVDGRSYSATQIFGEISAARRRRIEEQWSEFFSDGDGALILEAAGSNQELARNCLVNSAPGQCAPVMERLNGLRDAFVNETLDQLSAGNSELRGQLQEAVRTGQMTYEEVRRLDNIRSVDARLAIVLSQQPQEVRDRVYADIRNGTGDNAASRTAAWILNGIFDDETILNMYISVKREQAEQSGALQRTGAFDEAMAGIETWATQRGERMRSEADAEAVRMAANGQPQAEIDSFLLEQYRASYAQQTSVVGLVGGVQFLGDYSANPPEVAERTLLGLGRTADAVILDDTSMLEYLRRTGQSVEYYQNASPRVKAEIEGRAIGWLTTVAVEAATAKGGGIVARRTIEGFSDLRRGGSVIDDLHPNGRGGEVDPTNPRPGGANSPDTDGEAGAGSGARANPSNYNPQHTASAADPLDQRLPNRNNQGSTQGIIDYNGMSISLTSGRNGPGEIWYDPTRPAVNQAATHVEGHAAAIMVENQIREMTITINNRNGPCGNCMRQLPERLPQGYVLNVRWLDNKGTIRMTQIVGRGR